MSLRHPRIGQGLIHPEEGLGTVTFPFTLLPVSLYLEYQ